MQTYLSYIRPEILLEPSDPFGLQFHPGVGVGLGNDYTLYALKEGIVTFKQSKYINSVGLQAWCLG